MQSPLIHNITNYVAMTPAANALLAIGASPLMSFCPEEMTDIVSGSAAVSINIGCLDSALVKAAKIAAATAQSLGKKWVFDPVGVGASSLRMKVSADLSLNYGPSIIRCNASEAIALARTLGLEAVQMDIPASKKTLEEEISRVGRPLGVDSLDDSALALPFAVALSRKTGAVVSVSGAVDYITDGSSVGSISNGSPLMPFVTALGCTATALSAAFLAVQDDSFLAAMDAMALMGTAGRMAQDSYLQDANGRNAVTQMRKMGTGTFAVRLLDELSTYDADEAVKILDAKIYTL